MRTVEAFWYLAAFWALVEEAFFKRPWEAPELCLGMIMLHISIDLVPSEEAFTKAPKNCRGFLGMFLGMIFEDRHKMRVRRHRMWAVEAFHSRESVGFLDAFRHAASFFAGRCVAMA